MIPPPHEKKGDDLKSIPLFAQPKQKSLYRARRNDLSGLERAYIYIYLIEHNRHFLSTYFFFFFFFC